jgi:hypothetical protein
MLDEGFISQSLNGNGVQKNAELIDKTSVLNVMQIWSEQETAVQLQHLVELKCGTCEYVISRIR